MSDEPKPTIHEALSAVMGDVQSIGKDSRNDQQHYLFRGVDDVMNAVGPALRKHGVVIVPECVEARYRDTQTTTGKATRETTVMVTYRAYGPAGDSITIMAPGESLDAGDKGTPKAMSVAYRTALLQALTIPTDEPDPDSYSHERVPPVPKSVDDKDRKRMFALATKKLGTDAAFKAWLAETVNYTGSRKDLNYQQVAWITTKLDDMPDVSIEERPSE